MDLFAAPVQAPKGDTVDGPPENADADPPARANRARRCRFAVKPACVARVHLLLSVREYARRWPQIPKHELMASSVVHPHVPQWRWLLHMRRLPLEGGKIVLRDGLAPLVRVCEDCGQNLSADDPKFVHMPKYALSNDNWIGRLPGVLNPGGDPLTDFERKSLARGRMCVNKVIAEPEKRGPPQGRQGGLRGNSIAFPQAKVELRQSKELPPPFEEARDFMSKSVVIALAGADIDELHNAKFAEIRRQAYIDAGQFFVKHNLFYADMEVNEQRAVEEFAESGATSRAVLLQATRILDQAEYLEHKLDGPADTGCAGLAHEKMTKVDGEAVESEDDEDEPHVNAGLPDEEFPADALPTMHFCADELTSGDLDDLQAIYKVRAEMEAIQETLQKEYEDDVVRAVPKRRVRALQTAVKDFVHRVKPKSKFAPSQLQQCGDEIRSLENHTGGELSMPWEGYVQGTASKPLSMYGPEQWVQCWPDLFPYGDGVFGLARRKPMTFLQCCNMHLLREELSYQVTRDTLKEASAWFANPESPTDAAIASPIVIGEAPLQEPAATTPSLQRVAEPSCRCKQCSPAACEFFKAPKQSRWGASRDLICCYYDSWRRMEQIRKARGHVQRAGFMERLERVCAASVEQMDAGLLSCR